jgi:hypothetical protein
MRFTISTPDFYSAGWPETVDTRRKPIEQTAGKTDHLAAWLVATNAGNARHNGFLTGGQTHLLQFHRDTALAGANSLGLKMTDVARQQRRNIGKKCPA